LNMRNNGGSTALIFAAMFGHTEAAKVLLRAGADKSITDAQGNTALAHARHKGNEEMIELLTANH
ncbi:MAG: ankyrin repeat domain-containing protein, partial [Bacteroidota bacterium]